MDREKFLANVRAAAAAGRQHRVEIQPIPENVGYVGCTEDLCTKFAAEVNLVGGEAWIVDSPAAAREKLTGLLEEAQAKTALCWQHPLLDEVGVAALLQQKQIETIDHEHVAHLPAAEYRQAWLDCNIGISSVDRAIAETGTLVIRSRPGQERVASLLPPYYITLVAEAQIVPDLLDVFAWQKEEGLENLPSNMTLITGPSKTGDIELQLTTGVHGPGRWRVIVIRGLLSA